MSKITHDDAVEAFEYLDEARERMNPMEAAIDFQHMFDWSRSQRANVFAAWAKTFDGESSADDRIARSDLPIEEMV